MQIGKKIYYELATGNVIVDTGERQGDVVETTKGQDFEMYFSLQHYDSSAVGVIQLNYGEFADHFGKYPFHVDPSTHTIVWDFDHPFGSNLTDVQNAKIAQLTDFYQQATVIFQSSALGSVHTYLADDTSLGKFNAEYTFVNGPSYDNSPINWFTVEEGGQIHTKEQFNQVWLDGRNYLVSQFDKWDSLVKQVKAATDTATVNSIVW